MGFMLKYIGNRPNHEDFVLEDSVELNFHMIPEDRKAFYDVTGVDPEALPLSRKHAVVTLTEAGICIEDLGSRAGTYVNDVKIGGDLKTIHTDWRIRNWCGRTDEFYKIRQLNMGKVTAPLGAVIELGKEMFDGQHKYQFIKID